MSVSFLPHGFSIAPRLPFGRRREIRFDEIDRIDDGALWLRDARRIRVSAEELAAAGSALAPIATEGTRAAIGGRLSARLRAPHGPRIVARDLIAAASALRASDLHLEPGPAATAARVRIEGTLAGLCEIPRDAAAPLAAALKGLAGCVPWRTDLAQEGRIARDAQTVASDVRASFVPTPFGDRVALRLFGRLRTLDELGFALGVRARLEAILDQPRGLLLIAGATGSGKTTSIYAMLARLAAVRPGAHLSLEDPVEQRLRAGGIPVDQVELDPARGITGESMLAAALRQDVDALAVGEIRTPAEATLALQAAHTGRLVLAGVHAGSPQEAVQRLADLGADRAQLDTALLGVVHQEWAFDACACGGGCERCGGAGRVRRLVARFDAPERKRRGAA